MIFLLFFLLKYRKPKSGIGVLAFFFFVVKSFVTVFGEIILKYHMHQKVLKPIFLVSHASIQNLLKIDHPFLYLLARVDS